MNVLLGIGNRMRGDDGFGSILAERFAAIAAKNWRVFDAGIVPENFTAPVRRLCPDLLVVVDAAEMGLPPGRLCRIDVRDLTHPAGFDTHQPSLQGLIARLTPESGRLIFVAVQPASTEFDAEGGLTPPVLKALKNLMEILADGRIEGIKELAARHPEDS